MASDITIIGFTPQKYMDRQTISRIKSHAIRKVRQDQASRDSKKVATTRKGRTGVCLGSLDNDVLKTCVTTGQPYQQKDGANRGTAGTTSRLLMFPLKESCMKNEYADKFWLDSVLSSGSRLAQNAIDLFDVFPVKLSAQLISEVESCMPPHPLVRHRC